MPQNKYIIKKKSGVHGWGIFAKINIPKGTRIIEYVGEKITKAEAERRGSRSRAVYIFELNKKYDIDGHVDYNTTKYINHSCAPNCEAEIIRGHIWIIALRDIPKNEEIFYNYGYDLETYNEHRCLCRSSRCPGFITAKEHWTKLKKALKEKSKKFTKLL